MNETGVGSVDELFDKRFSSGFYANKIIAERVGAVEYEHDSDVFVKALLGDTVTALLVRHPVAVPILSPQLQALIYKANLRLRCYLVENEYGFLIFFRTLDDIF